MAKASNQDIAKVFYKIADILEIQSVPWKPQAYRAAANAIEALGKPLGEVYAKGGVKALDEIPGVGEAIAKKIEELVRTGKLKYYGKLLKALPIKLDELDSVPGLGPKKIRVLYEKLGVKDLKSLQKAAEGHKIAGLPGFAEKSEQQILKAITRNGKKTGRIPLSEAKPVAERIVKRMNAASGVLKADAAGSFRRRRPTVGDLDILVSSKQPEAVTKSFLKMPSVKKVLVSGQTKSSVVLGNGLQVDLRVIRPEQWGSALLYFTGSKAHNIALRRIAIKKGLKLSEYGLFKAGKPVASQTEKNVYNALGLTYIKPEQRENEGEIEKAMKGFRQGSMHAKK
jgi:DNA polymerase (family 10)